MSTSKTKATEASKDTYVRKVGQSGLRLRIRLPPKKRLPDSTQIMSTGAAQVDENLTVKNVLEQTDNNTRSTTCTAAEVMAEEACSNPPGLSEDTKNLSAKEVPKQTNNNSSNTSSLASKLMVEEVNSNCLGEGLCKKASSNSQNETLSRDTPPEKVDFIALGRNSTTDTGVQGDVHMRFCEGGNKNILGKELSPESSRSSPAKESCNEVTDKTPSKNLAITGVYGVVEKNYSVTGPCDNAKNNILSNRLFCEMNNNMSSMGLSEDATINCPSKNLTTSAVKCEEATEKLSAGVQNNVPIRRPAVPANDKVSKKRPHSSVSHATDTDTCKYTSGMKGFPSVGQSVEQSSSSKNLEAIKVYKEFEEKVRRTVYLDNLSHLATEAVIKTAFNQFGAVRNVNFLINYTVPYDIPQSALVEMETEKDAESVVSMLNDFPFMVSGMPRPVRGKRATATMFNDRPRKPGGKIEFCWVGPTDPDYQNVIKFKEMAKRHEVENLALIKLELEGEELLARQQQDKLNCNYRKLETLNTAFRTDCVDRLSHFYNMKIN